MKYLGLVIMILTSFGMCGLTVASVENGEEVLDERIVHDRVLKTRYMSRDFFIDEAGQTIRIKLTSNLDNEWMYYGVALYRVKDNKVITADDKELQYYSGYEGGEYWTEGRKTDHFSWKLKEPGDYRVMVYVEQTNSRNISLRLRAYLGYRENWPLPFLTGAWFLSIWFFYRVVIKD